MNKEGINEVPGLGQIVADNLARRIDKLISIYPFLARNPELSEARSLLFEQSMDVDVEIEEVELTYRKKFVPAVRAIKKEIKEGTIISMKRKGAFPEIQDPETFQEIVKNVKAEIEEGAPEEAKAATIDSVIMGDIKLSDVFLPFQKEIKERVFAVLREIICAEDRNTEEAIYGEELIYDEMEDEIFEILEMESGAILEEVEAKRIDRKIAQIIICARENIKGELGESSSRKEERFGAIKAGRIGVISEKLDESKKPKGRGGRVSVEDIRSALRNIGESELRTREESVLRMRTGESLGKEDPIGAVEGLPKSARARLALLERAVLEQIGTPPIKITSPDEPKDKKIIEFPRKQEE